MNRVIIVVFGFILSSSGWKGSPDNNLNHNIQNLQNTVIQDINNGTIADKAGLNNDKDKQNQEIEKLKSIQDLETAGRQKQAENQELNQKIFIDSSKLEAREHQINAKAIADATERELDKFTDRVKQMLDPNCSEVKGTRELKEEHFIQIQNKSEPHVADELQFCESLRNQYDCYDTLTLTCSNPYYVAGKLTNVTGNMTHTLSQDGSLYIGVNQQAYFWNSWGAQQDFTFYFQVDDVRGIDSFQLMSIHWADYVLVKLNGNIIFQAPNVNGRIEMSTNSAHHRKGVLVGKGEFSRKGYTSLCLYSFYRTN